MESWKRLRQVVAELAQAADLALAAAARNGGRRPGLRKNVSYNSTSVSLTLPGPEVIWAIKKLK